MSAPEIPAPVSPGRLPFHPWANAFDLMAEGPERDEFDASVAAEGLDQKIVLWEEGDLYSIADGRNRYCGLIRTGRLTPDADPAEYPGYFTVFEGDSAELWKFIARANLRRRHDSPTARAIAALRLASMRQGERTDIAEAEPSANLPKVSQAEAAEMVGGVSERTLRSLKHLIEQGAPELFEAVRAERLTISAGEALATLSRDEQVRILASADPRALKAAAGEARKEANAASREKRLENLRAIAQGNGPLPDRKYPVLYADPPWMFETRSENGKSRSPENHYPCESLPSLQAMQLGQVATDDACLFMWATVPHLAQAMNLMAQWGFTYKSHCIWVKDKIGTGYWFRNQHELLLVGTRGNFPPPPEGGQMPSVLEAPVGKHSEKPDEMRAMIETYWPDMPRIELFARSAPEGWDVWGNQAGGKDGEAADASAGTAEAEHV